MALTLERDHAWHRQLATCQIGKEGAEREREESPE
jgi:hypothetical protein